MTGRAGAIIWAICEILLAFAVGRTVLARGLRRVESGSADEAQPT